MRLLKSTVIATALSASLVAPAIANESANAAAIQFSATDMQQMFEQDAGPMQVAALSRTEMKETEGAWVANAIGGVIGFITGNFIYLIESSFNSNATFSFTDYAQTVGTSTVLGAFDPGNSVANAGRAVVTAGVGAWNMRP